MFESLQRNRRSFTTARFLALLSSMSFHAILITAIVILPLVYLQLVPEFDLLTILIAPPVPPRYPPPVPILRVPEGLSRRMIRIQDVAFVPDVVPKGIPAPGEELPVIVAAAGIGELGFAPPAGTNLSGLSLVGNLIGSGVPSAPPPPPPPQSRPPVRISGGVQESKLIKRVAPEYPAIAQHARVTGAVLLEVMIDEEGNVSEVRVLNGHLLLIEAAVNAVRQWKYSPTLLSGEPIPVVATVTIIFRLN